MKKIIILLAMVALLLLVAGGCSLNKECCPPEDAVVILMTPFGPIPGIVQKDSLSKEKHGKYWMTPEEFEAFQKAPEIPESPPGRDGGITDSNEI